MNSIRWSSKYVIGEPALDAQHKVLIDAITELQDAIECGRAQSVLAAILHKLTAYVQYHFAFEERWYAENRLITLPSHRMEHLNFNDDVLALGSRLEAGTLTIGTPVLRLMLNWLYEHICVRDRAAVDSIRSRQASAVQAGK
jgi:hemerythrin